MQLYSNIDEEDADLHRMLYVFACVSPKCISSPQHAIRVFRGYARDEGQFASNELFDRVFNAKDDHELIKQGLLPKPEKAAEDVKEEEEEDDGDECIDVDMKEVGLEFEEWAIETDLEPAEVTKFYLKEARKLRQNAHSAANKSKKGGASKVQIINDEEDEDEEDDEEDELEKAFLENAMNSKQDAKRVEKLLKSVQVKDEAEEDVGEGDEGDDAKMEKLEMKELEKIIEDKHANYGKISRHYKLFEYVARSDPDQVLRYAKPRHPAVEPLWMSEKGLPAAIPPCPRCGGERLFECQVMPQTFDRIKELMLVDWNTIAVYTCAAAMRGKACYPDFAKKEHYLAEYAFVQFSEDFSRVQLGDEKDIKKQEQLKKQQQKEEEGKAKEEPQKQQ